MDEKKILETIRMFDQENLDIRTVTMGISLLDCIDEDIDRACQKIYDKIYSKAKNLIKTTDLVSKTYSIPIINNRISVTPIALLGGATKEKSYLKFAQVLDKVGKDLGVDFIGGFSALVHKGFNKGDKILIDSIPEALSQTDLVCSSINVGSSKAGINMDAVKTLGQTIVKTAELTKDKDSIGCAKLVVFANAVEDNPFMAGAFHGIGMEDCVISVGSSILILILSTKFPSLWIRSWEAPGIAFMWI